ncbi:hypothetical protein HEL10_016280 [Escherichia coli]|nr:hypothetical protein [Escherichia coli]
MARVRALGDKCVTRAEGDCDGRGATNVVCAVDLRADDVGMACVVIHHEGV